MSKSIVKDKAFKFALEIIKLYQILQEQKEFVISKQLLRSATSIGANITEGLYGQSKADFVSKLSISLKEACESRYWLELLKESNLVKNILYDDYLFKSEEIIKILTSIINKTKSTK
jgi:four helix bundle protein